MKNIVNGTNDNLDNEKSIFWIRFIQNNWEMIYGKEKIRIFTFNFTISWL